MMKNIFANLTTRAARRLLAHPAMFPLARRLYHASLNGMGILNFEDFIVSGEHDFLRGYVRAMKSGAITVLDVGANVGSFSSAVRALWPEANIWAFEPHPITYAALRAAAERYGFKSVNAGCGDTHGSLEIFDYANSDGSSHASLYRNVIEDIRGQPSVHHTIDILTLDEFASSERVNRIDLLKIDTEGHEYRVLRGAANLLREGRIDIICFEFNEMNVVSRVFFKDFYDLLSDFELFRLLPRGMVPIGSYHSVDCEIFAYQNIVATRRALVRQAAGETG